MHLTGHNMYIPRHAHKGLSDLIAKSLIFLRTSEQVFASELWGAEAHHTVRHHVFYQWGGKPYTETVSLSNLTKQMFGAPVSEGGLNAAIGVQELRHFVSCVSQKMMSYEIDPREEVTYGLDALEGHTTSTADRMYGLQKGQVGTLNDRTRAVLRASNQLWHRVFLGLKVEGKLPTVEDMANEAVALNEDGTLKEVAGRINVTLQSLTKLVESVPTLVQQCSQHSAQQLVPTIISAMSRLLDEKLADLVIQPQPKRQPIYAESDPDDDLYVRSTFTPATPAPPKAPPPPKPTASTSAAPIPAPAKAVPPPAKSVPAPVKSIPRPPASQPLPTPLLPSPMPLAPLPLPQPRWQPPREIAPADTELVKSLLKSETAEFRCLEQYHVFDVIKEPSRVVLHVAGTGAGKTLSWQLLMSMKESYYQCFVMEPYNVLYHEMLRRTQALGLTVAQWNGKSSVPDAQIVITPLEAWEGHNNASSHILGLAAKKRVPLVVIDEART